METRQAKRRRLSERALAAPRTVKTPLYFDALPRDALMVIIRHLSTRPYVSNWHSYVNTEQALQILQYGGALTESARDMYTSLDFLLMKQIPSFESSALHTRTPATFNKLLIEQGPRLTKLSFATAYTLHAFKNGVFGFANGAYFEYCTQLRELTFADCSTWREQEPFSLEPILQACGGVLEKLRISGNPHLHTPFVVSIIRHCRALESLSLEHHSVTVRLDQFWQVVGMKLKHLTCFPPRFSNTPNTAALNGILRHCKLLESVEILGHPKHVPVTSFYKSMGERLRVLRFDGAIATPTPEVLAEILAKCRNAAVDIHIRKNAEAMLRVLGGRVRDLNLRCVESPTEQFAEIGDALTGLRELTVYSMRDSSRKVIEGLFNAPKSNLRKLIVDRIDVYDVGVGNMECVHVLEKAAGAAHFLRELECVGHVLMNPLVFRTLLSSNQQLERFKITYRTMASVSHFETFEDHIKRLVNELVAHKRLREFEVRASWKQVSKEIRTACVPLRGRELNFIAGKVQYLPTLRELI